MLLNVFYLYRLDIPDEYHDDGDLNGDWRGHRWWYNLAQVCRWWRYLIFASPLQLDLHLLCTNGVPIANMLAHSPPLPLTIRYHEGGRETTEEDDEGILLALRHSDRLHYISLYLPSPKLRKFITIMDEEFPILERMYIWSRTEGDRSLVLPRTFQAPHLRHFASSIALPIGSPLLTTTVGLVSLMLTEIPPSAYFSPNYLLTRLSLMPQLETLLIRFYSPLPNRDVERQSLNTPIMTHITLPNLRVLIFTGVSAYLEGLLNRIRAPLLALLDIQFFNQLTFTVPRLLQFIDTLETLSFGRVQLAFGSHSAEFKTFQLGERGGHSFIMEIKCRHLDWQVSSVVQILTALQPVLSAVEQLTLSHVEHSQSPEWHNEIDPTQWRGILRPFSNLTTLHVQNSLASRLSRSLQVDDGEPPVELLPNLKELGYSGDDARDAFIPFIDERQVAGHPVNLTKVSPRVFRG